MQKKILLLLLIFICIAPAGFLFKSGYFSMHDDMQAMRIHQMAICFQDWQIPCRWVPDMGYGYGYPQFNYYPPLPYYVMTLIHFIGVSIVDSVKIGFILTFLISAIGMYLLGNKLWGKSGAIISTLFYLYAPYRAVNVYDRGAMGEIWAMAFFPWIMWSMERIWQSRKPINIILLAISISGLMTSHLLSTFMIAPLLVIWWIIRSWQQKQNFIKDTTAYLFAGLLSFGLSAYYVFPSLIEKKYAHLETLTMGYFNYLAHFGTFRQIFTNTHWGYGSSLLGPYDDMSISIGIWHVVIVIVTWIVLFLKFHKTKQFIWLNTLILTGTFYLFLVHQKSTPIWKLIPTLEWLQFPWRFLAPASFIFSLSAGAILYSSNNQQDNLLSKTKTKTKTKLKMFQVDHISYKHIVLICLPLIFINISYMRPKTWFPMTDELKFSNESWQKQQTISIFDYLPIGAKLPPTNKAPDKPWFIAGKGEITEFWKGSNWQEIQLNSQSKSTVVIPLFYFPGWQVKVNNQIVPINWNNDLGLITFEVNPGVSYVKVNLINTPVRLISNFLTLISIFITIGLIIKSKKPHIT